MYVRSARADTSLAAQGAHCHQLARGRRLKVRAVYCDVAPGEPT